ncbi:MAG: phosphate acyltransferase PlsX [Actinomycetota bacterium]
MTIAIDGLGGDYAPLEIVKGVAESAQLRPEILFIITGPEAVIHSELGKYPSSDNIKVVDAPELIEMGEEPGKAVRGKKNSSIVIGTGLVKEGKADAFMSAGNTGAAMASALLDFGRIEGIKRPAIAVRLTTKKGNVLLLDAGANADCKPEYLPQFAVMGATYSRDVLGVEKPQVGLLNIGGEAEKGSLFTKEAFKLLKNSPVDFSGNVEGKEMFNGDIDVVVTDGFTGNVVLKIVEGVGSLLLGMLKNGIMSSPRAKAGGFLLTPALMDIKRDIDPEETGGAVLLGLNGVCIIAHGSSSAKAIKNAVGVAVKSVENDVVKHIKQGMS